MPKVTIGTNTNNDVPTPYNVYFDKTMIVEEKTIPNADNYFTVIGDNTYMLKYSALLDLVNTLLKNPNDDDNYRKLLAFLEGV